MKSYCVYTMIACAAAMAGCATSANRNHASMTFYSNPSGATISSQGQNLGNAPQVKVWTLRDGQNSAVSAPVVATWESGATATATFDLTAGQHGAWTFQRPQDVPGLQTDVQWAKHLQQQQHNSTEFQFMMDLAKFSL